MTNIAVFKMLLINNCYFEWTGVRSIHLYMVIISFIVNKEITFCWLQSEFQL